MGTAKILDEQHLLASGDVNAIESAAHSWPFEAHVLITTTTTSEGLDDVAHQAITNPHVVAIAVDPVHHHVSTRFGTATGVKAGDYDSIAKAGSAHFRAGEWGAGIQAIGVRAQASSQAHVAMSQSSEPVIVQEGLGWGTWAGLGLLFATVVGCVVWLVRRAMKDRAEARLDRAEFERTLAESKEQTSELLTRNIEEGSWANRFKEAHGSTVTRRSVPSPTTGAAAPPRIVPLPSTASPTNQTINYGVGPYGSGYGGGSNDILTGVLIGEALSEPRERVVERVVVHERASQDSGGSDAGWSGSSSSSNDSTSSNDSGGSSSSYDSGSSSSDSGSSGGGSDGGGGGDSW